MRHVELGDALPVVDQVALGDNSNIAPENGGPAGWESTKRVFPNVRPVLIETSVSDSKTIYHNTIPPGSAERISSILGCKIPRSLNLLMANSAPPRSSSPPRKSREALEIYTYLFPECILVLERLDISALRITLAPGSQSSPSLSDHH